MRVLRGIGPTTVNVVVDGLLVCIVGQTLVVAKVLLALATIERVTYVDVFERPVMGRPAMLVAILGRLEEVSAPAIRVVLAGDVSKADRSCDVVVAVNSREVLDEASRMSVVIPAASDVMLGLGEKYKTVDVLTRVDGLDVVIVVVEFATPPAVLSETGVDSRIGEVRCLGSLPVVAPAWCAPLDVVDATGAWNTKDVEPALDKVGVVVDLAARFAEPVGVVITNVVLASLSTLFKGNVDAMAKVVAGPRGPPVVGRGRNGMLNVDVALLSAMVVDAASGSLEAVGDCLARVAVVVVFVGDIEVAFGLPNTMSTGSDVDKMTGVVRPFGVFPSVDFERNGIRDTGGAVVNVMEVDNAAGVVRAPGGRAVLVVAVVVVELLELPTIKLVEADVDWMHGPLRDPRGMLSVVCAWRSLLDVENIPVTVITHGMRDVVVIVPEVVEFVPPTTLVVNRAVHNLSMDFRVCPNRRVLALINTGVLLAVGCLVALVVLLARIGEDVCIVVVADEFASPVAIALEDVVEAMPADARTRGRTVVSLAKYVLLALG
mmetsp:Transcript_65023/g.188542  ORF Transcript_65023/g.188542 Transcript_65023/m.188542 type:complete len:546 (-) Transcript_65023:343-1980(-)